MYPHSVLVIAFHYLVQCVSYYCIQSDFIIDRFSEKHITYIYILDVGPELYTAFEIRKNSKTNLWHVRNITELIKMVCQVL